ncbi:MAG: YcfA family protein [Microgenomates group bacterium GW2011_GWC2_46_7]|nr:MAG: YcfA family protein [Microgenomates group bacterium GW2011_GWC2_46_7]
MPKRYTAKQVLKALHRLGFSEATQRGSHLKVRGIRDGKLQTAIIPMHHEIAIGTLSSILRQANVTKQELEDNI